MIGGIAFGIAAIAIAYRLINRIGRALDGEETAGGVRVSI